MRQATLPLHLGGAGIRTLDDDEAAAIYCVGWLAMRAAATELARALGRPLEGQPQRGEMDEAAAQLASIGII
eukprot:11160347-Lingulodinium_polyedra.AAC.1